MRIRAYGIHGLRTIVACSTPAALWPQALAVINPAPDFSSPSFHVGRELTRLDTDLLHEMYGVRQVTFSERGRLLVAIPDVMEVREFDMQGRLLRRIGRLGSGPGENRSISSLMRLAGDSVLVYDQLQRRINIFGPARRFARSVTVRYAVDRCCSPTGIYLGQVPTTPQPRTTSGLAMTADYRIASWRGPPVVGSDRKSLVTSDTARIRLFARAPRIVLDRSRGVDGEFSFGPVYQIPFVVPPMIAFTEHCIVNASGAEYEIHIYSSNGRLLRVATAPVAPEPVTRTDIRRMRDSLSATVPDEAQSRRLLAALDTIRLPSSHPVIDALLADGTSIWVRSWSAKPSGAERWARFDEEGHLQGSLVTPPNRHAVAFFQGRIALLEEDPATGLQHLSVSSITQNAVGGQEGRPVPSMVSRRDRRVDGPTVTDPCS